MKGLFEMKKILSLFVLAGAMFASVGCDDKPKSSTTKVDPVKKEEKKEEKKP